MQISEDQLEYKIDILKKRMNYLLGKKHPLSKEIIEVSMELDKLIVIYQKLFL